MASQGDWVCKLRTASELVKMELSFIRILCGRLYVVVLGASRKGTFEEQETVREEVSVNSTGNSGEFSLGRGHEGR